MGVRRRGVKEGNTGVFVSRMGQGIETEKLIEACMVAGTGWIRGDRVWDGDGDRGEGVVSDHRHGQRKEGGAKIGLRMGTRKA